MSRKTLSFKIFLILSVITAVLFILLHLASAFIFRNLVIESKNSPPLLSSSFPASAEEKDEDVEIKFSKSLLGVKNLEQNIHAVYHPNERENDIPLTIVFCGPSAATLPRLKKIKFLSQALSCNLVMFEYRPNGSSSGIISPSLATLVEDVVSVINWLQEEKNIRLEDIVLMGYSLGGLPAISIARQLPKISKLVLVNSFCSFSCLTSEKRFSPLLNGLMLFRDFFPELTEVAKNLKQSVAVIYGTEDKVIPYRCTEQLIANIIDVTRISIEGGHSDFKINRVQVDELRKFLGIRTADDVDEERKIENAIKEFNATIVAE